FSEVRDVALARPLRLAVGLPLTAPDNLPSGALQAQTEPSDSGEQFADASRQRLCQSKSPINLFGRCPESRCLGRDNMALAVPEVQVAVAGDQAVIPKERRICPRNGVLDRFA